LLYADLGSPPKSTPVGTNATITSGGLMPSAAFRLNIDYGRWWLALGGIVSIVHATLLIVALRRLAHRPRFQIAGAQVKLQFRGPL
jgi:hypothetical protein